MPILPADRTASFWPDDWSAKRERALEDKSFISTGFAAAVMGLTRIEEIEAGQARGDLSYIKPSHVFEFSALISQMISAHITFDGTAIDGLVQSLKNFVHCDYGHIIVNFLGIFSNIRGVERGNLLIVANTVTTWAIIGPFDFRVNRNNRTRSKRDRKFGCPAYRMCFAIEILRQTGLRDDAPTAILNFLDKKARSMCFQDALEWMVESSKGHVSSYEAMADRNEERRDIQVAYEMMVFISSQREAMVKRFLSDPEEFLMPEKYMNAIGTFPAPPIRVEFSGGEYPIKYDPKISELVDAGIFAVAGAGEVQSLVINVPSDLDRRALFAFENLQIATDINLTGVGSESDIMEVRSMWKDIGIVPVNI